MKKLLLLLLILPYLAISQSADATPIENILLTNSVKDNLATRVIVQDSITKELKFVLKSTLNTNISIGNKNANTFQLLSSTGSGPVVPQATTTEAGLLNASDKVLINTISGKENVANKQNSLAVDGTGVKFPTVDAVNAGLNFKYNASNPSGFTANSTDAQLRDRTTHTGTQTASTISDIQSAITNNTAVLANTAKITNATHTGDATGSTALTLATVNSNVGTFNNVTVNVKGLVTGASNIVYASGSGSATNTNTGDNATNSQYSGLASSKENTITAGTTSQYFRGDKTFQTLNKTAVGLANVDNTSDANKPISTATQTALNLKANLAGGNTFTGTQNTLSGIVKVGNRPVSTRAISFSASLNDFVIDNTVNGHSFEESSRLIASTNNASFGFYDNVPTITSLGSINPGHFNGFQSRMRYEGAADFLSGGFNGMNSFYSDIFIAGSGNVSATSGLYIQNSTVTGTGRVLNQYGVIIGNLNAGTISNRGIACYTYRNFLQGLSIGSDVLDTDNPLRVEGNGKFTGTVTASPATLSTHLVTKSQLDTKISGSGTTNQLAKFTGSGTVGNSSIFDNGNVGIQTITPSANLHIGSAENPIGGAAGTVNRLNIQPYSNTGGPYIFKARTVSGSEDYLDLYYGTNHLMSIRANSKVGINQPNPIESLDVVGNGKFSGNVTASPATLSTQLATLGQVRPYKIYVALLTQTGSSAPVATVLENTLGGTVVWTRSTAGVYAGTLSSAFTLNKTFVVTSQSVASYEDQIGASRFDSDIIAVTSWFGSTPFDDRIQSTSIEIRVYN
jgi:hypothetical protein